MKVVCIMNSHINGPTHPELIIGKTYEIYGNLESMHFNHIKDDKGHIFDIVPSRYFMSIEDYRLQQLETILK